MAYIRCFLCWRAAAPSCRADTCSAELRTLCALCSWLLLCRQSVSSAGRVLYVCLTWQQHCICDNDAVRSYARAQARVTDCAVNSCTHARGWQLRLNMLILKSTALHASALTWGVAVMQGVRLVRHRWQFHDCPGRVSHDTLRHGQKHLESIHWNGSSSDRCRSETSHGGL